MLKSQLELNIPVWQVTFASRGLPVWLCSLVGWGCLETRRGWAAWALIQGSHWELCSQKKKEQKAKLDMEMVLTDHFCWWQTGGVVRREGVDSGNTHSNIFCSFELFYSPQSWHLLRFIIYCLAVWQRIPEIPPFNLPKHCTENVTRPEGGNCL